MVSAIGIIICICTSIFAIYLTKVDRHSKIESTLKYQLLISTGLLTVAIFFIAHTSLPFVYYIKYNAVD